MRIKWNGRFFSYCTFLDWGCTKIEEVFKAMAKYYPDADTRSIKWCLQTHGMWYGEYRTTGEFLRIDLVRPRLTKAKNKIK